MKLEAKGISRSFFRKGENTNIFVAVKPTDFVLEEGKLTEITGRSGCGKTTFSNMLSGLLTPTEGTVLLDDKDLYAMSDKERSRIRCAHFGIIPQGHTGLQSLTVLENVLLPSAMYHSDVKNAEKRARELLSQMNIAALCDVYANELSGGELRRMAVARALINEPEIIIADEPTSDLDDEASGLVLKLLKDHAKKGASVLMITHEKDALKYADNIMEMG